ncbi:MAG: AAA family ATPase [Oscillospiraceae bacterium]|nr:AAA family ATPase [Oscillospiraceae bacterium]
MNIKQAKQQVKNAMTAYFSRDEFGEYEIPLERQRPIFLMGPPGIGKTAIMEQIAQELGVGLVSYSMTHHTRQSALGLPFITTKNYGGRDYSVSEYTMSEIIASVYDLMEETGVREGILFLDEINCVSETLAPAMLQFLQFKTFGRHRVPDGWIVVTAGNPPEYNNSVREFDIVTWDRLKRIDIEPDYRAWKEYAAQTLAHPAVRSYLDIKESDFYRVESGVEGRTFVTARGWSDLSDILRLYEKNGLKVDADLVVQYLQNKEVAKSFALYYDLFNKYQSDYQVDRIFAGDADEEILSRAANAKFDEKLSLLGLLLSGLSERFAAIETGERVNDKTLAVFKELRERIPAQDADSALSEIITRQKESLAAGKQAGKLSRADQNVQRRTIAVLEQARETLRGCDGDPMAALRGVLAAQRGALSDLAGDTGTALENTFAFCEQAFGEGQELLILVTELTADSHSAHFISRYGSEGYYRHNKALLFYERQQAILRELDAIDAGDL